MRSVHGDVKIEDIFAAGEHFAFDSRAIRSFECSGERSAWRFQGRIFRGIRDGDAVPACGNVRRTHAQEAVAAIRSNNGMCGFSCGSAVGMGGKDDHSPGEWLPLEGNLAGDGGGGARGGVAATTA